MSKRMKYNNQLQQIKRIIECNDIAAVNVLLESGEWVLLNSYISVLYGRKPMYSLGLISKNEENKSKSMY